MKTILLLTYDISPYRGSEAAVSWNYVANMSKENKLIVLYGKQKDEIDNYLRNNEWNNIVFCNIKQNEITGKRLFFELKYNWNYRNWHKRAYKTAQKIIAKEQIDVVHYLNPIGFKEPGYLWKLDKPYIWGPITAVHYQPKRLYFPLKFSEKAAGYLKDSLLHCLFRLLFRVRKAVRRAEIVLSATPATQKQLLEVHKKISVYIPENGILEMENTIPIRKSATEKLRLIWIGTICVRKNLVLLLDALSLIKNENWELHIVGDGHLKEKMQQKAIKRGIENKIVWYGNVSRDKTQEILSKSHLHIITSLGEGNPTTIWEAMAKGIPTMTLDHCGMSGVVCEKCGIKIPIKSYKQVTQEMAENIKNLIENPQKITDLSKGAIECAEKYTWNKRRVFFNQQYEIAITNSQKK